MKDVIFYKKVSSLKVSVSLIKCRLQFSFTKCLNPEEDIKNKKFDYKNSIVFSLNLQEAVELYRYITKCIKNHSNANSNNIKNLEFIHEKRVLTCNYKNNGIILSVIDNSTKNNISFGISLNSPDIIIIRGILKSFFEIFPMISMTLVAYKKYNNKMMYDNNVQSRNNIDNEHNVDEDNEDDNESSDIIISDDLDDLAF